MGDWLEVYGNRDTNTAAVTSGASIIFCQKQADREGKSRHNSSFNTLFLTSTSSQEIAIILDGLKQEGLLLGAGAYTIKAEEGIYFDFIEVKNNGSGDVDASKLNIKYGISKERSEKTIKESGLLER